MEKLTVQDVPPNFRDQEGNLFLVRCAICQRENFACAVAKGYCTWCGWSDKLGPPSK